jgi:hypothetical protein
MDCLAEQDHRVNHGNDLERRVCLNFSPAARSAETRMPTPRRSGAQRDNRRALARTVPSSTFPVYTGDVFLKFTVLILPPYVERPAWQELFSRFHTLERCGHMSGLLRAAHGRWPR